MKDEKFNLSKCIEEFREIGDKNSEKYILIEDVKEFIRRLKKEINNLPCWNGAEDYAIAHSIERDIINKLAGDKLI